jgi:hypothetical protein
MVNELDRLVRWLRALSNGFAPATESMVMRDAADQIEKMREELDSYRRNHCYINAKEGCSPDDVARANGWDCFRNA